MKNHQMLRQKVCPLLWTALLLAGCGGPPGPPRYKVNGQVLLDGQPLKATPPLGQIKVLLLAYESDPSKLVDPQEITYDPATGKFVTTGSEGKGVEAGKYRVAVYQYDPFPTDKLNERFGRQKSPITVEIKGGQDIPPIELSQYMK